MKKYLGQLMGLHALAGMGGSLPEIRIPAEIKREMKDRRKHVPPRSMTPEEKEYYDKHKNLNGFYK